ncbi:MAG TPA: YciI family protein [Usitatibacter sp.]|jgi:hypothetical protein
MRYLCLIYLEEGNLGGMPEAEVSGLNARHLELNEQLLRSGHFIEAEALQPAASTSCVRMRDNKVTLTDGPYMETKEVVAGFYLVEARDLNEAINVAARIPSAHMGTIEIRPCRDLLVEGVAQRASSKPR